MPERSASKCPGCGYTLSETGETRCPECGLKTDLAAYRVARERFIERCLTVTAWSLLLIVAGRGLGYATAYLPRAEQGARPGAAIEVLTVVPMLTLAVAVAAFWSQTERGASWFTRAFSILLVGWIAAFMFGISAYGSNNVTDLYGRDIPWAWWMSDALLLAEPCFMLGVQWLALRKRMGDDLLGVVRSANRILTVLGAVAFLGMVGTLLSRFLPNSAAVNPFTPISAISSVQPALEWRSFVLNWSSFLMMVAAATHQVSLASVLLLTARTSTTGNKDTIS